jgi:hypothetical protein
MSDRDSFERNNEMNAGHVQAIVLPQVDDEVCFKMWLIPSLRPACLRLVRVLVGPEFLAGAAQG